jgi:ribosome biogenesis GTPase
MTEDYHLIDLEELGWNPFFNEQFNILKIPESVPARVISVEKYSSQVLYRHSESTGELSGKLRFRSHTEDQYPVVGDWVVFSPLKNENRGIIHTVLPRKSKFSRKAPGAGSRLDKGRTEEQILAANVDTVFIVNGLDGGRSYNLRRIERYLTLILNSGADPVIILNKLDLCPDVDSYVRDIELNMPNIPVHPTSATQNIGLDALQKYLVKGSTTAFLGSSGVGKSAIINVLLGTERQATGDVRESDRRGRHTTTRRELILLPTGGIVIDTPGLREIQAWTADDSPISAFDDIEMLAEKCRFSDCTHQNEPGCAVIKAVNQGSLDSNRLQNYHRLKREQNYLIARQEGRVRTERKERWKKISKMAKRIKKQNQ